ncbi:MAG: DeoR family transcriptional regulator [Methanosphaera sp.]|nr:DeoR family transcriptional regulator [Methanosphaera sp.]
MKKINQITYKEYMNLFKISKSTARRDMKLLIEYNFVYKEKMTTGFYFI